MKTKLNLLKSAGFLATVSICFGQPVITQQPQSCTNVVGTTATFLVEATDSAPLAYQWQKLSTDWTDLVDRTNTAMALTNVQTSDAMDYRVVVTNADGAVTSDVAHLTVLLPPTFQFTATSYTVAEAAGTVSLTVQRLRYSNAAVTVDYATADGSAINGLKYTATNGTLAFAAGETNKTLLLPILNEGFVEGTKYFRVILSNPTGGAVLGAPATATVNITDNDTGLHFASCSYQVAEVASSLLISVARGDDGDFPVTVDYFTTDGTATNGLNYLGATNTLFFAAGDTLQTFTIPVLNDGLQQPSRTFFLGLRNPTNQVLGTPNRVTVTILHDPGRVQLPANRYWVAENEGLLALTVVRGNDGVLAPFTVDYATADLTAVAGVDYLATNGTLTFAQGEMVKTVTVPIIYDEQLEPDRQFKLTLSNPTGGVVLGPNSTATITILDTTGLKPHRFDAVAVLPGGSVQLTLGGGVSQRFKDYYDLYPIEVSTNLVDWTPLVTVQRTNSSTKALTYTDASTTNCAVRFYRTPSNHLTTPFSVKPSGPYAVGVTSRLLTDLTRVNCKGTWTSHASFMVSVWYPAVAQAGRLPGPLLDAQIAQDPFFCDQCNIAGYPATFIVDRTRQLVEYGLADAPCATNLAPCPILLCTPEGGGWRASLAEKAANLASHGYIVVVCDPCDAIVTVWPDGTYLTLPRASIPPFEAIFYDRIQDLTFILDELTRWNANDAVFAGRLDLAKVAVMGTCWGFEPAAEFCRTDPRCKAAILVSCTPARWPGSFNTSIPPELDQYGVGKPSLVVFGDYSDAANYYDFLFNKATKDVTVFQIQGAASGVYQAMILVQDFYLLLDTDRLDTGREGARTIADYSLWFLNKYLKGSSEPTPSLAKYPRIRGFKQK
jgi:hypothetical protein